MADLICGPTLGRPLADALQAVTDLEGPSLLNALFGRFQALQKGLRQVRSFGVGKGARLAGELCGGSGHAMSIACGAKLVNSPESASVSPNAKSMGSARTNIKVIHRGGLLDCSSGKGIWVSVFLFIARSLSERPAESMRRV